MADPLLETLVQRLASRPEVRLLWLYGSRARGDHAPHSDYDLAIAFDHFDLPYTERRLAPELLAMDLSTEFHHPVQVVDINLTPLALAVNILADGRLLVVKDELRYCREVNRIEGLWRDQQWYRRQLEQDESNSRELPSLL